MELYLHFSLTLFFIVLLMLTFLVCHILGISTTCTNPILYGFLNENFLTEFKKFLSMFNNIVKPSNEAQEVIELTQKFPQSSESTRQEQHSE